MSVTVLLLRSCGKAANLYSPIMAAQDTVKGNKLENEPSAVGVFRGTTIIRRKVDHESPGPSPVAPAHPNGFGLESITSTLAVTSATTLTAAAGTTESVNFANNVGVSNQNNQKRTADPSPEHRAAVATTLTKSAESFETPPEEVAALSSQPAVLSSSVTNVTEVFTSSTGCNQQDMEKAEMLPKTSTAVAMPPPTVSTTSNVVSTTGTSSNAKTNKPARFVVVRFQEYTNRWIHKHVSCKDRFMMERPVWLMDNPPRLTSAVNSPAAELPLEDAIGHHGGCHARPLPHRIVPPNMALLEGNDLARHLSRCAHGVKACRRRDNLLMTSTISTESVASSVPTVGSSGGGGSVVITASNYTTVAAAAAAAAGVRSSGSQFNPLVLAATGASSTRFDVVTGDEASWNATGCSSCASTGGSPSRTRRSRGAPSRLDHMGSEERDVYIGESGSCSSQLNGGTRRWRTAAYQECKNHSMTEGDAEAIMNRLICDTTPECSNRPSLVNPPVSPAQGAGTIGLSRHSSLDFLESVGAGSVTPGGGGGSSSMSVTGEGVHVCPPNPAPSPSPDNSAVVSENLVISTSSAAVDLTTSPPSLPISAVFPLQQILPRTTSITASVDNSLPLQSHSATVFRTPSSIVSSAATPVMVSFNQAQAASPTEPDGGGNSVLETHASHLQASLPTLSNVQETGSSHPHMQVPLAAEVGPPLLHGYAMFNETSLQ